MKITIGKIYSSEELVVQAISKEFKSWGGNISFKARIIKHKDKSLIGLDSVFDTFYFNEAKRHFGILFRKESFWMGVHYSKECKRYCLNILPCITIWWTKKGGLPVDIKRM